MNTTATSEETNATHSKKVLYTAKTHTVGGRHGASRTSDGHLDITLSTPGTSGTGTNPEQLFAAGWSACYQSAIEIEARKKRITLSPDSAIDAEVDLCMGDGGYFLQARLNVSLPGLEYEVAQALAEAAHLTCPYSKATHGNIDVVTTVV
jgi:osmotically inducible protein OsmC